MIKIDDAYCVKLNDERKLYLYHTPCMIDDLINNGMVFNQGCWTCAEPPNKAVFLKFNFIFPDEPPYLYED